MLSIVSFVRFLWQLPKRLLYLNVLQLATSNSVKSRVLYCTNLLLYNLFQPIVLNGSMGVIAAAQQDFVCKWDSLHLKL